MKYEKADLVIHNAKIYTVNGEFEIAQAMAIKDGIIVAIDKEREIMNKYRADEFFDAQTRPIYPGFIDGHCHFLGSGLNSFAVSLKKAKSKKEIAEKLIKYNSQNKELKWLVGYGWNENNWEEKTISNNFLNEQFPSQPVLLWRVDGHSLLVNQKAIEIVNLPHEIKHGIVLEEDIPLFVKEIKYTEEQKKAALIYSEKQFFENGITTVSDAGVTLEEINFIKELHENYDLQIRIYAMLYSEESGMNFYAESGKDSTDKLAVNSIKLVMDGSVGSGTACFKKPYRETVNYGKLLVTKDSLRKVATYCYENDFQLNVHCIGDSAVKITLDIMGEILQVQNDRRWRIEHAQAVDKIDMDKFLKYSIIPSVQPTHGIDDRKMALHKLHKYAFINSYKIETLLAQNGIITFGSDFPVADKNPIVTFYNAVVRKTKEGEKFSTLTGEKVTRKEALNAMTFWAAMANLQEQNRGSLEVGKYADFVILDRDIMKVSENDILKTQVKFTFLDGEKVFEQ